MSRLLNHALALGACLIPACSSPPPTAPPALPPVTTAVPIPPLVPAPTRIATCAAPALRVDGHTRVGGPRDVAGELERWMGLPASAAGDATAIELRLLTPEMADPAREVPSIEAQAFTIDVDGKRAVVTAAGRAGLFYGAQTLAQLAGARLIGAAPPAKADWSLPCVHIEDRPRSRFRAMHLDVVRHFFDAATVARYVDLLAFYRFNVFHWHLTDDQGFRMKLDRHPELASPDAAYSRSEMSGVVESARSRFITVIPEVEMPGHARAILAARPELSCTGQQQSTAREWGIFDDVLCAGNPGSLQLVKEILTEVADVFPSRLIHVGGDEVPDARWKACPKCQAAMKASNVDAVGLEHVFMEQVYAHLATLQRRPMAWDEALPMKPGTNPPVIVAWQSKERGDLAASRGFDVVYAPYEAVYFNFSQAGLPSEPGHFGPLPLARVRAFEPPTGPHVLGGEGAIWTEFAWQPDDIDTLAMPRAAALADALWSGRRDDFEARFSARTHLELLDRSGVKYFIEPPHAPGSTRLHARRVIVDDAELALEAPLLFRAGTIRYTRDGSDPDPTSPRYRDPLLISDTTTVSTALFLPSGRSSPVVRTKFVKEVPRPARNGAGHTGESGATCTYYEGHFHRLSQVPVHRQRVVEVDTITVDDVLEKAAPSRTDHFAFRCQATIDVTETGVQRFFVKSDDGARLTVDGEKVVEIDGDLGPREDNGEIALERGVHQVDVVYFQGTEGKELRLERQGPSGVRAPLRYGRLGSPSSTLP